MTPEFSKEGYLSILNHATNQGYELRCMRDAYHKMGAPVMLLRHDIDHSLDFALEIAEAEHQQGWHSTFFILLNNDFYNPLSPWGRKQIHTILSMGHEIGLHWDSSYYPQEPDSLQKSFLFEIEILSHLINKKVVSASQHNPIDTPSLRVDGFIPVEAYSEKMNKKYHYVSDSAMTWREHTPCDLIKNKVNIQFLSHPIWWAASGNTISEKLNDSSAKSIQNVKQIHKEFDHYIHQCLHERERLDKEYKASHSK